MGRAARAVGALAALMALACGGVTDEPVGPGLLVLDPSGGACSWELRDVGGGREVLGSTIACPDDVLRSPDGQRMIAYGEGKVWVGAFPPGSDLREVPAPPELHAAWPTPDGGVAAGVARYTESGVVATLYALEGDAFVQKAEVPGAEDPGGMGIDPLSVDHPLREEAPGWTSLKRAIEENPAKQAEIDGPSDALRTAVEAGKDGVGQLAIGEEHLAFRVSWGDTPHPTPPLVWCDAPDCAAPRRLAGEWPDQLAITPNGDLVLVTEEWTGRSARIVRVGETEPVLVLPPEATVAWER